MVGGLGSVVMVMAGPALWPTPRHAGRA